MKATLEAFRHPVAPETRQRLAAAWARVPARLRTPRQFLGRQYAGCGATIGAMPRCDFACRGCYLGQDANRVPPASLDVVKRQLARLRDWLGEGGNVQLTDGEVTLRPEAQLIELIRHARALGLVPMVMTHGDTFRRRPGLLERLMIEGGLTELSVHIDTTQRGRRDYREARCEDDLAPLREEFGALIRQARRRTGRRLEVATTVTVSRENLDGVADIVRWLVANAGAFKMVSFQPVAAVGRTEAGLREVTATELWERIAEGLYGERGAAARLAAHEGWLGHPACSRFVQGVVVHQPGTPPAFHALFHPDELRDRALLDAWLARFGGLTLRLDGSGRALARLTGVVARAPALALGRVLPFLLGWPRRLDPAHPWRLVARWLLGRARLDYLNIVSHHFMSRAELATPLGQERLALCVFKAPVDGELVSMCELNALGGRDRYYERLRGAIPGAPEERRHAQDSRDAGRPGRLHRRVDRVLRALLRQGSSGAVRRADRTGEDRLRAGEPAEAPLR
jgi:pyruvate-formate lyase-activating enzyme